MKSDRCFRARTLIRAGVFAALAGLAMTAHAADPAPAALDGEATREARGLVSLKMIDRVLAPEMDLAALRAADAAREAEGGHPLRFADAWDVGLDTLNSGTWENLDDQTLVWRLRVQSPGAKSVNFGFTTYWLPEGASLTIRALDGSSELRPFTSMDNTDHGELWTPIVTADDVLLELVVPEASFDDVQLRIGRISSGYKDITTRLEGRAGSTRSGSCNLDVICGAADGWPQVDAWRDEIPASGAYTVGGVDFCSGSLINNTANDLTPYFLTANHCGLNTGNDQSVVIYWNYENPTCRAPGSGASGTPIPKTGFPFSSGTTFRASNSTSDFCLVEVTNPLDPAWELTFAGWDRSGVDATSAVAIHHPGVDEKRISFENQPTTITTYLSDTTNPSGTHVRVDDWDVGTTEPGSSGSPLFDQNNRIIGQLHGGFAACGNNDPDWYGRLFLSWTGGGSSSSRLSDWLDPLGTGQLTLDTITGAGLAVDPAEGVSHQGPVGGPFSDTPRDYTLANAGPSSVNYEVSLDPGGTAPLLIDGGTSTISGSLAGMGGSTMVTVSVDATAAAALGVGTYSTDVLFDDTTNGRQLVRTHTLEVGLTEISVSPTTDLFGSGPTGGPFGPTRVYTVTNAQPNAVDVLVTASDTWISLDGGTSAVSFTLNGLGDSQNITVGYSSVATSLSAGFYSGSVDFQNLTSGDGDETIGVFLDAGRITAPSMDTPVTILDNSGFQSEIEVTQDVEIGDVNIKVDISHTYIGDLIIEVMSPTGTIVRLHNRTGGSTDDLITTYDDATNTPDGPGLLADYNGEDAIGTWTLIGTDNASQDTGTLNSWTLLIGAATLPPPDCVGDLDGDNDTDVLDFSVFTTYFGTSVAPNTNGDMDGDGFVDVIDFGIWTSNFGCPN